MSRSHSSPEPAGGASDLTGPVHVVGAGLLGTSVGLALTAAGIGVWLSDAVPDHVRTASALGAGRALPEGGVPQVVVVAVPPDDLAQVIADALESGAVVTDVGSVKTRPLEELRAQVPADVLRRYVGGHPMAGSERSGPLAAAADLFVGRPWAVTPAEGSDPAATALVEDLARVCGATLVRLTPADHDVAVARISHLPHLLSVLTAGQLADAPPDQLALSGQGVRDVTRIAGSDPRLWSQILRSNAGAIGGLLRDVRAQLDAVLGALDAAGPDPLRGILGRGVAGTEAIPAKHGGPPLDLATVFVAVPDHPGSLARIFGDCGDIGVNIEDVRIDHDPGREVGLLEIAVRADAADRLRDALTDRGWAAHR